MDSKEPVYITGHMHPDTDSIAAAIAYAFFKHAQGVKAIPCRLGKLNPETNWLLQRFGFEEPILLEDARKTIGEIEIDPPASISPTTTIYESIMMMQKNGQTALSVVDPDGKLLGMVTKSDLTTIGLGDTAGGIDLLRQTSIDDICKTINGTMVYRDTKFHLNGKVSIIALTDAKLSNYEIKDRIVILGDDAEAQKELIRKGAGMLIVVWTKEIQPDVIETAKQYHCPVIISGHGSMNTSRYVYFAPPVHLVMTKKLITFKTNELAEDVGRKMMTSRYRTYPVIDQDGKLQGYASRYHIMNSHNKKIILVDHNEFSQSVRAVEKAQLLEVVDHHRICDFATTQPVSFRNEIVGSTATIIATMFRENQIPLPQNLAGLLLGAVLSDTLMLQSPTTTDKDRQVADILAACSYLDIEEFGKEMFANGQSIGLKDLYTGINQDIKTFDIHSMRIAISQIMVASTREMVDCADEVQRELNLWMSKHDVDLLVVAFTSVLEHGSVFFSSGEHPDWILEVFPDLENESHSLQRDILSRKSQILPMITSVVDRYA